MSLDPSRRSGIARLHHAARIVKDHEANRKFVEDGLGIPLVATWCENVPHPEKTGETLELCHTFYELDDGSALAFFQFGSQADYESYAPRLGTLTGMFDHIALKVDEKGFEEMQRRATLAGLHHFDHNHGYCRSLYIPCDQGYMMEFAWDAAKVEEINAASAKTAHADLKRWLAGDHSSNNNVRHS
jgi:glyoxylase I family protein